MKSALASAVVIAPPAAASRQAPGSRVAYFDNLKVALVAAVIVGHAGNFYGAGTGWIGVRPAAGPSYASAVTLGMAAAIGQMFVMGAFFFMAGSFTPGSLARKGAGPTCEAGSCASGCRSPRPSC